MTKPVPPIDLAVNHEPWLDRWRQELGTPLCKSLEIGSGRGWDARTLTDWGFAVTTIDASPDAIRSARNNAPAADHLLMDVRDLPGPLEPGLGLVVASLSLHYFDEVETRGIFGRIRTLLAPNGRFAFRVNAEDDLNFGATGAHEDWACVNHMGVQKQFFTESKIRSLLAGWSRIHALEKRSTRRFGRTKSFFEVLASKVEES